MTNRQRLIYDFVVGYIQQHNYAPSVREIAKVVKRSPSVVHGILSSLQDNGHIKRIGPRAIEITKGGPA